MGLARPEIRINSEMRGAGVIALENHLGAYPDDLLVEEVYRAMYPLARDLGIPRILGLVSKKEDKQQ